MRAASARVERGAVSEDLSGGTFGASSAWRRTTRTFIDQARRAAEEIPRAEFISIEGKDHLGMDTAGVDPVLPAVLRTLREA